MSCIDLTTSGHLAVLTLNRPDKYNCFNRGMALELQAALDECSANKNIRAVYLTGAGRAFCSGQDLQEVTAPEGPSFSTILSEHFNPIITRLRELPKPVVCGVNGVAAGAGVNIALACDITVAAHSAVFIQAFSRIGLIPDSGGTFLLPRLIGWQRAAAVMMLGEPVAAPEAAAMGMIYKVFPDAEFAAQARRLAERLAEMPTRALALTKKALNHALAYDDLKRQLHLEETLQTEAGKTYDYQEGVRAFLEKRKPEFRGD